MKKTDEIDIINDIDSLILSVVFDHYKVIKAHSFDGVNKWNIYLDSGNVINIDVDINGDTASTRIVPKEKMTVQGNLVHNDFLRLFVQLQQNSLTKSEFKLRCSNAEIVRNERIKAIDYKRDLN